MAQQQERLAVREEGSAFGTDVRSVLCAEWNDPGERDSWHPRDGMSWQTGRSALAAQGLRVARVPNPGDFMWKSSFIADRS